MSKQSPPVSKTADGDGATRREFLGNLAAAAASTAIFGTTAHALAAMPVAPTKRKIKVGVVGCGGRGAWIAGLFQKHGGYEMHALADYFQDAVDRCGDALGVDKRRRFTGLSGYKKVLESGVEALVIEDIPYFYPEQAQAAVDAGCHVYMAKPVAVDVPGCLAIEEAARQATQKKLCFHVDYQMPTDPVNIEIAQRIWDGGLGKMLAVTTWGRAERRPWAWITPRKDARKRLPRTALASRHRPGLRPHRQLRHPFDRRGDVGHTAGSRRRFRPSPHLPPQSARRSPRSLRAYLRVPQRHALDPPELPHSRPWAVALLRLSRRIGQHQIAYWGKSYLRVGPKPYGARDVVNLYEAGAKRNIATFYQHVTEGRHDNPTVRRTIDGTLTTILGREAGHRGVR